MITLSSFPRYRTARVASINRASNIPDQLVLDTAHELSLLLNQLRHLPILSWEADEVVQFVLDAIAYERKAPTELEYACLDLMREAMGTDYMADTQRAVQAVSGFGRSLVEQLQRLRVYQNGYLFYHFHSWCGQDLVLMRFTPDAAKVALDVPHD